MRVEHFMTNQPPGPPGTVHILRCPQSWTAYAWIIWLALIGAGCAVYFTLSGERQGIFFNLFSVAAAIGVILGVRLHRPAQPLFWYLLACGLWLQFTGQTVWTVYATVLKVKAPFPSLADV